MPAKKAKTPRASRSNDTPDILANCVLQKRAERGEIPDYSYPQRGLPKVTVKSAPAVSLLAALSSKREPD